MHKLFEKSCFKKFQKLLGKHVRRKSFLVNFQEQSPKKALSPSIPMNFGKFYRAAVSEHMQKCGTDCDLKGMFMAIMCVGVVNLYKFIISLNKNSEMQ